MKIGIDIVEHSKVENKSIEFIKRVLSTQEYNIYILIKNKKRQVEYIASRFASKEAIFKAYKDGNKTLNYKDISILNNDNGSPYVSSLLLNDDINITISHSDNYSIAFVLIT